MTVPTHHIIPEPPAGGRWTTTVTFSEPGTYVLRAVASDGALFTYDNVTVTVNPLLAALKAEGVAVILITLCGEGLLKLPLVIGLLMVAAI